MAHVRRAMMDQAESMPPRDPPEEPSLVDLHLAAEIGLLGEVIATAGTHSGPLTEAELDAALGLHEAPQRRYAREGPPAPASEREPDGMAAGVGINAPVRGDDLEKPQPTS
jgi:hypothetical protein